MSRRNNEEGGMLLAVLIASAVFGLVAAGIMLYQERASDAIALMRYRGELQDLRRYVGEMVYCPQTLSAAAGCSEGSHVALYRNASVELARIPSGGEYTVLGQFKILVECGVTPTQFVVKVSHRRGYGCSTPGDTCWIELFPSPLVCS